MNTQMLLAQDQEIIKLLVDTTSKDSESRTRRYARWIVNTCADWYAPDLAAYRDKLLVDGLAPSSVAAHLSTIRAQYRRIIRNNETRQRLFDAAPQDADIANRKAFVDEVLIRLDNALDPEQSRVKVKTSQDKADGEHLRLSKAQADALMAAPGMDSLTALRDTAIIALMLCTGLREAELCALDVEDLRQRLGGELAVHVKEGKGCKERLVPYGELSFALAIVEKWLTVAGITSGAVFRSFWRGGRKTRARLTPRAVQMILASYPVMVDGKKTTAKPHDLRRTYARRLYDAGIDLVAIQQNLGHADTKTTLGYIGTLDADKRRAPAVYSFDLRSLESFTA